MLMLLKILLAALGPPQRQLHGDACPGVLRWKLGAFVEGHDEVSAQGELDRD